MVVSRMSSAPMAQCEELQHMLEKREAELDAFKEERRNKDNAINFLKSKIVSMQNQSRVSDFVVRRQGTGDSTVLDCPEDDTPTLGPHVATGASSAASAAAAIAERDQRIEALEQQLAQESQRSARVVNRMLSGGAAWELEETRRRLADRDREAASLRQTLEWQEREIQRISEQSTSDLEDLRQRFHVRDREVEELKRALEDLESSRREHHLEVELRRQSEQNRRLTLQVQREETEVRNMKNQLEEAREEVAWLWKSLHEKNDEQKPAQQADAGPAPGPPSPSQSEAMAESVAAEAAPPVAAAQVMSKGFGRKVCETFLGEDLMEALVPSTSPPASPPRPVVAQLRGGETAGAEAAAGDRGHAAERGGAALCHTPRLDKRPAVPPGGAEAAAGDKRPVCEAADAGAGVARRGGEDVDSVHEQSYPKRKPDKFGGLAYEGQDEIVIMSREGCGIQAAEDAVKTPDTVELELPSSPKLKEMLNVPATQEESASVDVEEPQEVCVTGGGAVISINFDDNEDIAAKEAKRQRVTRQIERRRQARGASAGTSNSNRRPSSANADSEQLRLPVPLRQSTGGSRAESPREDSTGQATPTTGGSPLLSARRFEPAASSSPTPQAMQAANCSPANNSDAGSCTAGKTATLHSKFEGLRDEMKRRRSERTAIMASQAGANQDAQELAEAVVAEANANANSKSSPVVVTQPSPASSAAGSATATPGGPPGGYTPPTASPISVAALAVKAVKAATAPASTPGMVARASSAGDSTPATTVPSAAASPLSGSLITGTSPMASARLYKANLIGPSPGERVIRTTAGGPAGFNFDRLSGLGGSTRAPPPPLLSPDPETGHHTVPPSPTTPNASPFFIAVAPQSPSAPSSPAMSFAPVSGQASPSAGGLGTHRHHPQRLRSVPQEHLSSARSNANELDRCRRNTLSLSARSVTVTTGNASSRVPQDSHTDVASASRPSSRSGDIVGEMEHDALHEAVVRFSMQRPGRYPLVRLSRGVYLYGNKKLVIAIHNDKLMVRIGGGFVHLESYLVDADRSSPTAASPVHGVNGTASFDPTPRMQSAGPTKAQAARRR